MNLLTKILNYTFKLNEDSQVSVKQLLLVFLLIVVIYFVLKFIKNVILKKRKTDDDKAKFKTLFIYGDVLIYTLILLIIFDSIGIKITGILTASAALLVGVGLALQTFFQDIISGVFILLDQTLRVGDVIEVDGKVAHITEIRLRTTRAKTLDNKVVIIPNHKYLINNLYNWTANNRNTRESVSISVAYGTDVKLVEELLLKIADSHPAILKTPLPKVLFLEFADSSLNFKIVFSVKASLEVEYIKSDIRFKIDSVFNEHHIKIPFPQREIYIHNEI